MNALFGNGALLDLAFVDRRHRREAVLPAAEHLRGSSRGVGQHFRAGAQIPGREDRSGAARGANRQISGFAVYHARIRRVPRHSAHFGRLSPAAFRNLRSAGHAVCPRRMRALRRSAVRHRRLAPLHARRSARRPRNCRAPRAGERHDRVRPGARGGYLCASGHAERSRQNHRGARQRPGRNLSAGKRRAGRADPAGRRRDSERIHSRNASERRPLSRPQPHHQRHDTGHAAGGGLFHLRRNDYRKRRAGAESRRIRHSRLHLFAAERSAEQIDRGRRAPGDLRLGNPGPLSLGAARGGAAGKGARNRAFGRGARNRASADGAGAFV